MSEFWTKWESQVIDGRFPLRRFLSESTHSAVFLTAYGSDRPDAAIKFVRADPLRAERQLAGWRAAAGLSHPKLVRILEVGRCRLGRHELLFIVMEYAEQTLAQILLHRALTFDEVREMLRPMLAALVFLHGKSWVHSQVKPTNVCVVDDVLKLASDTIHPAGEPRVAPADASSYSPPEEEDGGMSSAAGDIWSLGMTIVAALVQHPATRSEQLPDALSLPPTVPPAFADTIRQCLRRDPARRPAIAELRAQVEPVPGMPVAQVPAAPVNQVPEAIAEETPVRAASLPTRQRSMLPVIGAAVLLAGVLWAGVRMLHGHGNLQGSEPLGRSIPAVPSHSAASRTAPEPPVFSVPVTHPVHSTASAVRSGAVVHAEIPMIPNSAQRTIRGRIDVAVRVTVDASGKVIDEAIERRGPSRYFARLAIEAARKWRFAPADGQESSRRLLQFQFTRTGASANLVPRS